MPRQKRKENVVVTSENREELLKDYWLCGECDSPEYKGTSPLKFDRDILFLCECKKLHVHPHCLSKEIMFNQGQLKPTKDIKFYCLSKKIFYISSSFLN